MCCVLQLTLTHRQADKILENIRRFSSDYGWWRWRLAQDLFCWNFRRTAHLYTIQIIIKHYGALVDGDEKNGSIENQPWNYAMDRGVVENKVYSLQWPLFEDWPMENMASTQYAIHRIVNFYLGTPLSPFNMAD